MTLTATSDQATSAPTLRRLYIVRFVFAALWAALLASLGPDLKPATKILLFLYPAFDVAAAIVDAKTSRTTRSTKALYANMAISTAAAIGLAIAGTAGTSGTSGTANALRVWGAWAIAAGLVQLAVALLRRSMGGQWPMILSGGISVLAGASFLADSAKTDPSLKVLAGYAALGGIFFLVSALRLPRAPRRSMTMR